MEESMYEQEKQRATHLLILIVCTILIFMLTGESLLLGWETGAIVLLLLGLAASWVIHITEKIPESTRLWVYFILSMLAIFFYGIHETSIFDLAPLMILVIILYSTAESYSIIRLCVITYFLTMGYDFVFVLGASVELSALTVTRTILHLILVYMAGYMTINVMERRSKERKSTDNKIAELEETNRRTEDFLANVSHELRTPINAVTGITAVMLKNEEDAEKKKDLFSIQMAGHRLFGQIGDILDFTEIETGRIRVSEDLYIISSLINDIINGNQQAERKKGLELIFDIDPCIPSVLLGDEKKIKKILGHLIDNAFKFTQKGGVYVRVYALHKAYGVNLCIRVSDTGIGIAREELEKIRERFYQSGGGRNRRAGGLGLGLPIVYGMVSAMEGFIQIESTVGEGTTVSVSIPQKVSDEAPVMVVENRDDLCLACYLRPEKYEVPQVRDYYNEMISHMIHGLDVSLHRISNMDELKKLTSVYQLTHLFIGKEEYDENQSYFENLKQNIRVIVVADEELVLPQESRVRLLKKPFYSMPVVNILKAGAAEDESLLKEKYMICPGVRVLVVDDEPMNLMVAEGIFGDYQMSVTKAESGRQAIELCEKEDFDLIFLDHMMPEMDGVETLKRIRKIHNGSNRVLTIIAFTANAVSGAREMFLKEGFDEFVSKPVEPLELERVLRKVLPKSSIMFVDENYKKYSNIEETKEKQVVQNREIINEQMPEKHFKEDRIIQLENAGIHTHSGMQYCGGDKEFYVDLLTKFAEDAGRKEKEINDFFIQEDFENYCIRVHALKSTAKMVGADSLSENAKHAEMAAKNHDADYIREHHEGLLLEYRQVVQCIYDVLDLDKKHDVQAAQGDELEISADELLKRLAELKEGLDTFEADKAESLISEISAAVYRGESVGKLLYDVRQDVDDFEFGAASGKVEALMKKVEGGDVG
ncbi:MAG: response regulator [Thermoflexaceae bacterium]|nr:response regulator [Thermoflexaceae bacterium]